MVAGRDWLVQRRAGGWPAVQGQGVHCSFRPAPACVRSRPTAHACHQLCVGFFSSGTPAPPRWLHTLITSAAAKTPAGVNIKVKVTTCQQAPRPCEPHSAQHRRTSTASLHCAVISEGLLVHQQHGHSLVHGRETGGANSSDAGSLPGSDGFGDRSGDGRAHEDVLEQIHDCWEACHRGNLLRCDNLNRKRCQPFNTRSPCCSDLNYFGEDEADSDCSDCCSDLTDSAVCKRNAAWVLVSC